MSSSNTCGQVVGVQKYGGPAVRWTKHVIRDVVAEIICGDDIPRLRTRLKVMPTEWAAHTYPKRIADHFSLLKKSHNFNLFLC